MKKSLISIFIIAILLSTAGCNESKESIVQLEQKCKELGEQITTLQNEITNMKRIFETRLMLLEKKIDKLHEEKVIDK